MENFVSPVPSTMAAVRAQMRRSSPASRVSVSPNTEEKLGAAGLPLPESEPATNAATREAIPTPPMNAQTMGKPRLRGFGSWRFEYRPI